MDIIGYEGLYKIYDDGRVFSVRNNKFLKPNINTSGYYYINLYKNKKKSSQMIHTLVALHFIGERPTGFDIDHIDKNKLNNNVCNLRFISRSENLNNKYVTGKIPYRHISRMKNGFQIGIQRNCKTIFKKKSAKWSLDDAIRVRNEAYIKLGIEIDDVIRK